MRKRLGILLVALLCTSSCFAASPATSRIIYSTRFEQSEGYQPHLTLAGQSGWIAEGSGGNGLTTVPFGGTGQQAYIGFFAPTDTNDITTVWRPFTLPAGLTNKIFEFSVVMNIINSTNSANDDFRWSFYNLKSQRLFTLDFETSNRAISYVLDDGVSVPTGLNFEFSGVYTLRVIMNFARNTWMAILNDVVIATAAKITTRGAELTLSDVDAVWAVRNPAKPGNNFMVFDDYRITAENVASIPAFLEPLGLSKAGDFSLRIYAEPLLNYEVEVTTDFITWFKLGVFPTPNTGIFDFQDTTAVGEPRGFYRVRQVQ